MKHIYSDGGRLEHGYKALSNDCVCRSITIATGRPYDEVYERLATGNATQRRSKHDHKNSAGVRSASMGIWTKRKWFKDYMRELGFEWTPTMHIGSGCKVHLHDGELPDGRLVVAVSKHYTCVIGGAIFDTYDPQREVHSFRQFPGWETYQLKPGEWRNINGICSISRRCVYGYWKLERR